MDASDDRDLFTRIQSGDGAVLGVLFNRNLSAFSGLVKANGGTSADGEDLLQDALLVLWQNIQKPDFLLTARLDTYLYAIGRNLWSKDRRKWGRTSLTMDDETRSSPELSTPASMPEEDLILMHFPKLPKSCQTLLHLFYYEGWSLERIAEHMKFANAGTAKSKKYQCKCKLKALLRRNLTPDDLHND